LEAIADADQAIALQPNQNGDYYIARAYGFENLSLVPGVRVDQDRFIELALENMLVGMALPHTNPTAYYAPSLFLLRLGRCDEALEQNLELLSARGEDAAPVPVLHERIANALMCKGEYDEALEQIAIAIDVLPSCTYYFNRALMYYHSGAVDQALDEINYTIESCPSFSGTRYYLRALIHAERGNDEQAVQDLLLGSFNTWEQAGLKAYVESLLALNAGNRTQAVESLKVAEQTMDRSHGPFIERIQADLSSMGVSPEVITPNPNPPSTPMATLPEDHPTPPPETYVKYTTGAGAMRLEPGALHYFHFFAPEGFEKERVFSLKANLIGGTEGFPTELELLMHNPAMAYWQPFELVWGSNDVWPAGDYVNTSGDINIRLCNTGDEPIEFEDIGITIVVVDSSGTNVRYSYLDEQ
ncbi:MAG: tetratricopeptide repeat protein, partial [Anaerolineales bacterium]